MGPFIKYQTIMDRNRNRPQYPAFSLQKPCRAHISALGGNFRHENMTECPARLNEICPRVVTPEGIQRYEKTHHHRGTTRNFEWACAPWGAERWQKPLQTRQNRLGAVSQQSGRVGKHLYAFSKAQIALDNIRTAIGTRLGCVYGEFCVSVPRSDGTRAKSNRAS